jgi:hypothetical protein
MSESEIQGTARVLRGLVLHQANQSEAFRGELLADAQAAVNKLFDNEVSFQVKVHEDVDDAWNILIPYQSDDVQAEVDGVIQELASSGKPPTRTEFQYTLTQKAWDDQEFHDRLLSDGRNVINAELQAAGGGSVPADHGIVIHTEGPGECVVIVPPSNNELGDGELSGDDLETVSGGGELAIIATAVIGGVIAGIVNNSISHSANDMLGRYDSKLNTFGNVRDFGASAPRGGSRRGGTYRF